MMLLHGHLVRPFEACLALAVALLLLEVFSDSRVRRHAIALLLVLALVLYLSACTLHFDNLIGSVMTVTPPAACPSPQP